MLCDDYQRDSKAQTPNISQRIYTTEKTRDKRDIGCAGSTGAKLGAAGKWSLEN